MSGEAGPAPGARALAGTNPRPAATVSLRTKGLTRVMGSDALQSLDTLIGRTCLRGTQTRRPCRREDPDGGAEKTAGMRTEVGNDQDRIPRARVPVGMVHHPAGTSRATGQALADTSSEELCRSRTRARSSSVLGSSPRMTRTVAALPERRMQRDKTPNGAPEGAT